MPTKKGLKKRVSKNRGFGFKKWVGAAFLSAFAFAVIVAGLDLLPKPCANSISCIKDLSGNYEPNSQGTFLGKTISLPSYLARETNKSSQILGENTANKHIYVDLTNQRLYAYEDNNKVFDFPVSTGKWGRTPTGDFKIWIKLKYTRMSGGSGNDYYNLPNVPYTMFFYNKDVAKSRGFALHGAYWHNNFGNPMSHGCINIRPEDSEKLFYWATPVSDGFTTYATNSDPGTEVTIYGEAPE